MQAIITTYHGPTNVRGTRITARADKLNVRISISRHAYDRVEEAHAAAAVAFCRRMEWNGKLIGAFLNNEQYVWVWAEEKFLMVDTDKHDPVKVIGEAVEARQRISMLLKEKESGTAKAKEGA